MDNKENKSQLEGFFVGIAIGLILAFALPSTYAVIGWIIIGIFIFAFKKNKLKQNKE